MDYLIVYLIGLATVPLWNWGWPKLKAKMFDIPTQ